MKLGSPMIVVTDMERSLEFYKQVLGLDVILDFGANKTLTTVSPCRSLSAEITLSSTLKKTISTLSLKSSKNVMWNMYIRLLSIHGVSVLSAFMIRISTSLRSVRICRQ